MIKIDVTFLFLTSIYNTSIFKQLMVSIQNRFCYFLDKKTTEKNVVYSPVILKYFRLDFI